MTRWPFLTAAALALASSAAFADGPRNRLQKFDAESTEVKDVTKRPSKVGTWVESPENQPVEWTFPWMGVLGTLLCLGVAAPFAWRLYRNVNDEIANTKSEPDAPPPPVRVRRKLTTERPS
jgi:hypothetical protein